MTKMAISAIMEAVVEVAAIITTTAEAQPAKAETDLAISLHPAWARRPEKLGQPSPTTNFKRWRRASNDKNTSAFKTVWNWPPNSVWPTPKSKLGIKTAGKNRSLFFLLFFWGEILIESIRSHVTVIEYQNTGIIDNEISQPKCWMFFIGRLCSCHDLPPAVNQDLSLV